MQVCHADKRTTCAADPEPPAHSFASPFETGRLSATDQGKGLRAWTPKGSVGAWWVMAKTCTSAFGCLMLSPVGQVFDALGML